MKPSAPHSLAQLRLLHLFFWALLASGVFAAAIPEDKVIKPSAQDAAAVGQLKASIAKLSQQLSRASPHIRMFAQLADKAKTAKEGHLVGTGKVVKVANAQSWPDLTVVSFIVLLREDGSVAALHEVPVSESGDWNNGYTHYFDAAGNTVAFERTSSFFNACRVAGNAAQPGYSETSTYYYKNHKLLAKDYVFVATSDGGEKPMSPAKCEFHYRHPYTIHPHWRAAMHAAGLAQVWTAKP